jgi:hypothetical protein
VVLEKLFAEIAREALLGFLLLYDLTGLSSQGLLVVIIVVSVATFNKEDLNARLSFYRFAMFSGLEAIHGG